MKSKKCFVPQKSKKVRNILKEKKVQHLGSGRPEPWTSKRYCESCGKETVFRYDNRIGHARCSKCGYHKINLRTNIGGGKRP